MAIMVTFNVKTIKSDRIENKNFKMGNGAIVP